jgi:hypothetical protein
MRFIKKWLKKWAISSIYGDIKTVQKLESRDCRLRNIADLSKDKTGDWNILFYTGGRQTQIERVFAIPLGLDDIDEIERFVLKFRALNEKR